MLCDKEGVPLRNTNGGKCVGVALLNYSIFKPVLGFWRTAIGCISSCQDNGFQLLLPLFFVLCSLRWTALLLRNSFIAFHGPWSFANDTFGL